LYSYAYTPTEKMSSALDESSFHDHWFVESESPDYKLSFRGDTCEIISPKGLTLWRKEKLYECMTVEYDVMVVDEGMKGDRVSDMNCFWLASDPNAEDIWTKAAWRSGIFLRCYTLQMYYLGYGGNYNSTTRFRRYDGDSRGVEQKEYRPAILREYTDSAHLLKGNHWYHVKIESTAGRNRFFVDDKLIVDYYDPMPLREGWFGFRTTWSRCRITNFSVSESDDSVKLKEGDINVPLHWIGENPKQDMPVTFGVPFSEGEIYDDSHLTISGLSSDNMTLARWPDGSIKWAALSTVVPKNYSDLKVTTKDIVQNSSAVMGVVTDGHIKVEAKNLQIFLSDKGSAVIDSILYKGKKVAENVSLNASCEGRDYFSNIEKMYVERHGTESCVIRIEGRHRDEKREWLPFILRLYVWKDADRVKLVHTFIYDGKDDEKLSALGLSADIPLHDAAYLRRVAFATDGGGVWKESVRPLGGRRKMVPGVNDESINRLAQWDCYRLSCLTDNSFSIRKKATMESPWIGTFTGIHAPGYAFVGDSHGGMGAFMEDFWQSYPSSIEIRNTRSDEATMFMWLWSPESEPMNLCHYDTIAHGLQEAYEDVQEGMSSPYGIARTSTFWFIPYDSVPSNEDISSMSSSLTTDAILLPTPEYLHSRKAFGIWSLPSLSQATDTVEKRLNAYLDYYIKSVQERKWYGFWNYGDIMHQYDEERHEWKYDMGGFAWDNTELATPSWLWYSFLRSGRHDVWRMAKAMTRHNSEVDTYHLGLFAGLGSRHNVTHWGDGAKEARISQAAFNRFMYYLTADERLGDIMTEVRDLDTLLYTLDPMRLAEPRSKYPCNAPARLRIGPDWLAYVGNWMTEWERTGDFKYKEKILAGMKSIASLRHGIFTGNKALGYDPATGIISYDGDTTLQCTNHLCTIMGGFEVMNELMMMLDVPEFNRCWLDYAINYKEKAAMISRNHFPVRRLMAYGAYKTNNADLKRQAWKDLWGRIEHRKSPRFEIVSITPPISPAPFTEGKGITTNDAALWSLDAIYMLEVIK